MRVALASVCAGVSAWCSLATVGLVQGAGTTARIALLPPWWWLPLLVFACLALVRAARLSGPQLSPLFGSAVLLLPWLPVRLPPPAYLWTGPLTGLIWIFVVAAVIHARWPRTRSLWLTDASRAPVIAAAIALALYGASARRLAPLLPDGDSPHYLILAQSLIKDGDIRIENNHRRGDYLEYSLQAAQPDYLRRGVNGQIYSIHAPGLPAVIAPAMWLFGYPGVVGFLGLVAAIGTGLVWWLARLLTGDAAAAWFAWACCALTAPFFFLATEVFPDGLAASCLLIGLLPLYLDERSRSDARAYPPGAGTWLAAGAALALLPWLQTRLASLAAVSALLLLARVKRPRQVVLFAILPVVSAAGWLAFFYTVYGTPNPAAPYGALTQSSAANMLRGLPGVFFDQQFGLIPNAPMYGLVLAGCVFAALRLRRWSLELLALIVPYTISVAMYQHWWGGASAPARLLAPLSLVIGLGAARLWAEGSAATRTLYAAGLGVSAFVAAVLWIPDDGRLLINFRDGIALWLEWAHDDLLLARAAPSLFSDTPLMAMLKASVWVGMAVVLWGALKLLRPAPSRAARVIVLLAVMPVSALAIVWGIDGRDAISAARSETGLLRQLSGHDRWSWDFEQRRFLSADTLRSRLTVRSDDQRARSSPSHVLSAHAVPPGHYLVQVAARPGAAGTLTLRVGDTSLPFLTLPVAVADEPDGAAMRTLVLPVGARSLVIEADAAASRTVVSARLQPVAPDRGAASAGGIASGSASRAARYPAADAFFLDDNAYPEPTGFWIAGGRRARLVIARDSRKLTLFVRNAAVENRVTIEVDGTRQEFALAAGEERELPLVSPHDGTFSTLRVTSVSGFRPSQVEPGNKDLRYLGCWIELR
ncbi:MAG: hypothetical protein ABL982_05095 [Vicinamibacterales bacterium]